MKLFALCIATIGIASTAYGSACVQGATFSSYISAGSCTFTANGQSYTLQDFTFLSVAVLQESQGAGDFTVAESTGVSGPVVTITPNSATDISTNLAATETFLFGFDITSNNASIGFSTVNLGEQSSLSGLIGTTGTIAEEDCFGGLLPVPGSVNVASLGNGGLACTGSGGGLSVGASLGLSPGVNGNASTAILSNVGFTNSVDVLKEMNLTGVGGTLTTATVSVSSISQGFATTSTPEPGTFLLGGCGLVAVAWVLRRRSGQDSATLSK